MPSKMFKKQYKNTYPEIKLAIEMLGDSFFKTLKHPEEPFMVLQGVYSGKYYPTVFVWCENCNQWHTHGLGSGTYKPNTLTHRGAHCSHNQYPHSGYFFQGFNIDMLNVKKD